MARSRERQFIGWLYTGTKDVRLREVALRVFTDGTAEYPSGEQMLLSIRGFKVLNKTLLGPSDDRRHRLFRVGLEGRIDDPGYSRGSAHRTKIFVVQCEPIHVFGT